MAGIGDSWGTAEELLHPRGPDGRWIRKGGVGKGLLRKVLDILAGFRPRQFQSRAQAAQYLHNTAHKQGVRRMGRADQVRLASDLGPANADLQDGVIDEPSTKRFVDMMDRSMTELPDDTILTWIVGVDAFGFTPETAEGTDSLNDPGIRGVSGRLAASRGYGLTNIGGPEGPAPAGSVRIVVAAKKGTRVVIPAGSPNDTSLLLDRGQPLRITKVKPDGAGGWVMYAIADPESVGQDVPEPIGGPVGVRMPSKDREAKIRGTQQSLAKLDKTPDEQKELADEEARRQKSAEGQQILAQERAQRDAAARQQPTVQAPTQTSGPPPRQPAPGEPPPRTEPVVGRVGEVPAAGTPAGAPVSTSPTPGAPEPTPAPRRSVDLRLAVRDAGIRRPEAGPNRKKFNDAYEGVISGKKDPIDASQELERDADDLAEIGHPDAEILRELANVIQREYGLKETQPAAPAPAKAAKKAAKKAAPGGLTPDQEEAVVNRAQEFRGKERNDEERRIVSQADEILARRQGAPAKKAAVPPAPVDPNSDEAREATVQDLMGLDRKPTLAELKDFARQQDDVRDLGISSRDTRVSLVDKILGGTAPRKRAPAKKAAPAPAKKARRAGPGGSSFPAPTEDLDEMTKAELLAEAKRREIATPKSWTKDKIKAHLRGESIKRPEKKTPAQRKQQTKTDQQIREEMDTKLAKEMASNPDKVRQQLLIGASNDERQQFLDDLVQPLTLTEARRLARGLGVRGQDRNDRPHIIQAIMRHFEGAGDLEARARLETPAPAKTAAKAAVPGAAPGTAAGKITAGRLQPGMRILVDQDGNFTNRKTGSKVATIHGIDRIGQGGRTRSLTRIQISAVDEDGKVFIVGQGNAVMRGDRVGFSPSQTFIVAPEPGAAPVKAAKKAAPSLMSQMTPDQRKIAREMGLPDDHPLNLLAQRINGDEDKELLEGLHPDDLRQVARELGVQLPTTMPRDKWAEHIARSVGAFGESGPAPKKAAPRSRTSRSTPVVRDWAGVNADLMEPDIMQGIQDRLDNGENPLQIARTMGLPSRTLNNETDEDRIRARTWDAIRDRLVAMGTPQDRQDEDLIEVARFQQGRRVGKALSDFERRTTNGSSDRALETSIRANGRRYALPQRDVDEMVEAGLSRDPDRIRAVMDRITADSGVRLVGRNGEVTTLDRTRHDVIGGGSPTHVEVDQAGLEMTDRSGNPVILEKARVMGVTPQEASDARRAQTPEERAADRPQRLVPEGSVAGPRAQTPVETAPRAKELRTALLQADLPPASPGSARKAQQEIRDDLVAGRITPEEAIRRHESEAEFLTEDLNEVNANLDQGDLGTAEKGKLERHRDQIQASIDSNRKHSKFLRDYFKEEAPVVSLREAKELDPVSYDFLKDAKPDDMREAAKEAGLDPPSGDTVDEMFTDLLKQVARKELERRAAKKAAPAKKAAKKAAPTAPAVPREKERVDARLLTEGIDGITQEDIDDLQKYLDGESVPGVGRNSSPAKIADWLNSHARKMRDHAGIVYGNWDIGGGMQRTPEEEAERVRNYEDLMRHSRALDELAGRVRGVRRRSVKKAAPATPEVAKLQDKVDDLEKRRIDDVLGELSQSGNNRDRAEAALDGLTLPELRRLAEQSGVPTHRTKAGLKNNILDRYTRRPGIGGLLDDLEARWSDPPSRDEVDAMLAPFNKAQLLEGARRLGIPGASGKNMKQLRDEIREATVGRRLDSIAIRGFREERPGPIDVPPSMDVPTTAARSLSLRAREAGILHPGQTFSDVDSAVGDADRRLRAGESPTAVARFLRERATRVAKADLVEEGRRFKVEHDPDSLKSIRKASAEYLRRIATHVQQEGKPAKKAAPAKKVAPARPFPPGQHSWSGHDGKDVTDEENLSPLEGGSDAETMRRISSGSSVETAGGSRGVYFGTVPDSNLNLSQDRVNEIRAAVEEIVGRGGSSQGYVQLSTVREGLAGRFPRGEVDRVLQLMNRSGDWTLVPDANQKALRPRDRLAAVLLGNADKHSIRVQRRLEPAPTPPAKKAAPGRPALSVVQGGRTEAPSTPRRGNLSVVPAPAKKAAPARTGTSPVGGTKPDGPPLRDFTSRETTDSSGRIITRTRPNADEPVHLPNGGADQGRMHLDGEIGSLWETLYFDDREPNSFVNEIARIGEQVGTGELPLSQALTRLARMKDRASDKRVADRIQRAIDGLDAPPVEVPDFPDTVPAQVQEAMRKLADIPTARRRFNGKPSVFEKKMALIQRLLDGDEDREFDSKLQERDLHESIDGALEMRRLFEGIDRRELMRWRRAVRRPEFSLSPA